MGWRSVGDVQSTEISTEIDGLAILIIGDGQRWYAIEDRCSHAGCAFSDDGEIDDLVAVCDCHGSEFDVTTGDAIVPPATLPIRTFPTRVVGQTVQVEL